MDTFFLPLTFCVTQKAGLAPDCKLVCAAEQWSGAVRIVEADRSFDLTDPQPDLVDTLWECKVCLADRKEKLTGEEVINGRNAAIK